MNSTGIVYRAGNFVNNALLLLFIKASFYDNKMCFAHDLSYAHLWHHLHVGHTTSSNDVCLHSILRFIFRQTTRAKVNS